MLWQSSADNCSAPMVIQKDVVGRGLHGSFADMKPRFCTVQTYTSVRKIGHFLHPVSLDCISNSIVDRLFRSENILVIEGI